MTAPAARRVTNCTPYYEDVLLDTFGSRIPGDVQSMLADARIDLSLIYFDSTVLQTALKVGGAAYGTMPAAGTLMGASTALKTLATGGSNGFTFTSNTMFVAGGPIKKGTRATRARLSFRAIPYDASKLATSTSGAVLFT